MTAGGASPDAGIAPLGREEYVEQAHFFGTLAERLTANVPVQEVLRSVREEVLATSKLPMAIDFLLAELRHAGVMGTAMARLPHYFTPLQAYLVSAGEDPRGRFDMRIGLEVLRRDAQYRAGSPAAGQPPPTRQGLFLFQFEALCRNRLSYDRGLDAMAADPAFDEPWRAWLGMLRHKVGMVDLADLIYVHSEHYRRRSAAAEHDVDGVHDSNAVLFGEREGRIAVANRRKDPLLLFSSLQRHLGYPEAPRPEAPRDEELGAEQLARRLEQLEKRMKLLEEQQRGGIDLTKFYGPPED
ncbi:MAG: hypothetical protein AAF790_03385 [Planctomycetota bacterium]